MNNNGDGLELGPLCRAYSAILIEDRSPRESLNRFGLSRDDYLEMKAILEFIRIKNRLQEASGHMLELDLIFTGLLVGLQMSKEKANE